MRFCSLLLLAACSSSLGTYETPKAPPAGTDSTSTTGDEADADTDADSDSDSDADTDTDSDADSDADSDTDTDADSDADADTDADADADADTDSDTDTDTDTDADTDTDTYPLTDTAPEPWLNDDPADPPPLTAAPSDLFTSCAAAGGVLLDLQGRNSGDPVNFEASGGDTFDDETLLGVPSEAWYHLYVEPDPQGGDENESYFAHVFSPSTNAQPALANCSNGEWIALDPNSEAADYQYAGTFWFDAGDVDITFSHFCNLVTVGQCTKFEDTTDDCGSNNHPVDLDYQLCLVEVPAL